MKKVLNTLKLSLRVATGVGVSYWLRVIVQQLWLFQFSVLSVFLFFVRNIFVRALFAPFWI